MDNYTVNKLSKLSGVSIRTLHYYDEIGLLKPAYVGESGYRYYQEEQLLKLQQILFFRELGFELKQIQEIVEQDDLDKVKALMSQKKLLEEKIVRMQTLMKTIDKTIQHLHGKQSITEHELFKGFEPDSEQQQKHETYVREYLVKKYGLAGMQNILQGYKTTKKWSKEELKEANKDLDELCKQLVSMIEKKCKPDCIEVQSVIPKHYEWLNQFWTPTKETYAEHADFIMETELRKFYDAYHPELAQFIADAIKMFAERNL